VMQLVDDSAFVISIIGMGLYVIGCVADWALTQLESCGACRRNRHRRHPVRHDCASQWERRDD